MDFIDVARPLVEDLLRKHGVKTEGQVFGDGPQRYFRYEFVLRGAVHSVELASDSPWMYRGSERFECYLRPEWSGPEALAECFAKRLDRYLSGGSWHGESEAAPWWRRIGQIFRFTPSDRR